VAPGTVVLGAVLPLTGALAPYGAAQRRGVERAFAQVDAEGGLDLADGRRPVQLLVRDTRSEPDVAGQEALVLVRGPFRLSALLGPCLPPLPVVRVAESRQVPLVTGCQPVPDLAGTAPRHTLEVAPGEAARADAVFAALRTSPSRRAGVFVSNDRSEAPWVDAARRAGFDVAGTYRPQGREWGPAVGRVAADGVEVVVAVTQPPEGIGLWRALREQGLAPRAAYASEAGLGSAWHAAVGATGERTLTDLVHPSVRRPATPAQVDEAVTTLSSELTSVLLAGLRRSGTAERHDLRAALPGAGGQVAGHEVRFLGDQASRLPPRLARWEGGRLVPLPPAAPRAGR
jgi:branched-chain amino acid transport system substrate-binding protein